MMYQRAARYFYPRSPCGERPPWLARLAAYFDFYPRSPCGERPPYNLMIHRTHKNFYPRSPCGERRWLRCWQLAARDISIHALLAESDCRYSARCVGLLYFYPRSPCGERLTSVVSSAGTMGISIHALLAESDGVHYDNYNLHCVISIHALLAESDPAGRCTHPAGKISIHALLAESDYLGARQPCDLCYFYPRSPCGERRSNQPVTMRTWKFLSTLSLRRATVTSEVSDRVPLAISIHALLAESD